MTGKDAVREISNFRPWTSRLGVVFTGLAVIAAGLLARYIQGPLSARAQTQRPQAQRSQIPRRSTPAASRPRTTGSRPAARVASKPVAPSASATPRATAQQQLKVVAVVNGQQITRQQLAQETLRRYGSEVLESIINKQVIWQACQKAKITITEQDVNEEITRTAEKFGLAPDAYLKMLQQERDLAPNQYRREIIWPTLALRRLAAEQLVVTEAELKRAMETEFGPKVKARVLVVEKKTVADQLHAQLKAQPESFGDLAKQYSVDAQSASVGGLIPPVRMHTGDSKFEQIAFALQPGQIGQVFQVGNQYIILKCEKRIPETVLAKGFRESAERQLTDRLRDQKLRSAAAQTFQQLQKNAQVVKVYTSPELRKKHPGIAAIINGRQITIRQLSEDCIKRNGSEVLDGEVNRTILQQELKRRGRAVENKHIDAEIARAADTYGFVTKEGKPNVEAWLKQVTSNEGATVDLYVRDAVWPTVALKRLVEGTPDLQVTEDDLKRGFEANYGERVEVLAIVFSNQRTAAKVWDMARNRPTEQFFGELAEQYSIEPVSRSNAGKVPPVRRHSGQKAIEEAAFALQRGDISGIIGVPGDKYVVMYCQGRTKPVVQKFDAVKEELHRDILEKKTRLAMTREFDRLKEVAQIDNFMAGTSQSGRRAAPVFNNSSQPSATRSALRPAAPTRR